MKISIIIPIYNSERFLKKCLDSVINQSYKNLEIILINDGSIDKSGDICNQYALKDNRIKLINKKRNEGVSEARNTGIDLATGDYFYLLDSDDYIPIDSIQIFHQRAKETQADIIIGKLNYVDENGFISSIISFDNLKIEPEELMKTKQKFRVFFGKSFGASAGNKFYRLDFVKSKGIKFESEIYYGEDLLFNIKLYLNYPTVELINETTYYYFQNLNSVTSNPKKDLVINYIKLVTSLYKYAKSINKLEENYDLISFNSFTAIDNCCLNCFHHSNKKFSEMKREISLFKKSKIINTGLKKLAVGKYFTEIPRKDWKYFSLLFAILYNLNLLGLATFLQICRFKFLNSRKN
ncbi:glycosyltransferase family 2 protein [Ureibacillus manganicus]|uniref:glycosyltransferase family 2 protein n=1 Tax=Ureibacillus manganicus TaxID=1266064 RepID=UPI000690D856|nr:glycosyltransferase family 2 protein [Ureibacillus manganicus]